MMLTMREPSEKILDELCNLLQDEERCSITTMGMGFLHLTVSNWTRHCAVLQGSLCPAPCLPPPSSPDWKLGAGQGQSWGCGLG